MTKRVVTLAVLVSAMTAGALWVGSGEAWAGRACGANTGRNTNTTAPAPATGTGAGATGTATTAPAPAASPAPTAAPSGGGTTR